MAALTTKTPKKATLTLTPHESNFLTTFEGAMAPNLSLSPHSLIKPYKPCNICPH